MHRHLVSIKAWLLLGLIYCVTFNVSRTFADEPKVGNLRTINLHVDPVWIDDDHLQFIRENEFRPSELVTVDAIHGTIEAINAFESSGELRLSGESAKPSRTGGESTEIEFVNHSPQTVQLYWVDVNGRRQTYEKIQAGQSMRRQTYVGHVWEVVGSSDGAYFGSVVATAAMTPITISEIFPKPHSKSLRAEEAHSLTTDAAGDAYEIRIQGEQLQLRSGSDDWRTLLALKYAKRQSISIDRPMLSPDSKVVAAWKKTTSYRHNVFTIDSSPKGGGRAKLNTHAYLLPGDPMDRYELVLFSTETFEPLEVDFPVIDFGSPKIRWRNGHELLVEKVDRGHQRFRLFAIDPLKGEVRTPIDEQSHTFVWTAHASRLPLVTYLSNSDELIYSSEINGWRHLYLVKLDENSPMQPITRGSWVVRSIVRLDEEKRTLDLMVSGIDANQDPYLQHLIRVDLEGTSLARLTDGNGDHEIQFSPTRKYFIDTYSRVDAPPIHELRRTQDGALVCELSRAKRIIPPGNKSAGLPATFVAKGRDGKTDIWGILTFPPEYDPSSDRQYPIVESIYAGPHTASVPKRYTTTPGNQDLAEAGFIVVQIDAMGTAHRSKAFHDVCWHNLKDAGFPDRIAWIKAAAESFPAMDLRRVGIFGTSAGGQNACGALIFHNDFYKAAMASCGCHDNRMDKASWNEQWMGYPVRRHYAQNSNIENAAKLQGDLFLIVGELDENVPPESTLRLVDALIKADKTFEFLLIPGMGHSDGGTYGRARMISFFQKALQNK